MSETAKILRYHAREGNVFDLSNDTVVVTRALLRTSADEIERLRAALSPFAEIAKELGIGLRDDDRNTMMWAVPKVGDLRNALRVLNQQLRSDA